MVAPRLHPVRSVEIRVPLIRSNLRAPSPFRDELPEESFAMTAQNMFLLDPARPMKDPNDLARELAGRLTSDSVMHNCPCCHQTLTWPEFAAHARDCLKRSFKTLDSGFRVFTGASLPDER